MFFKHIHYSITHAKRALLPILVLCSFSTFAKGGGVAPQESIFDNPMALILLIIMLILLLVIGLLANVVRGSMDMYRDKMEKQKSTTTSSIPIIISLLLLFISPALFAQDKTGTTELATNATPGISGLPTLVFFVMVSVIFLELMVIFGLLYHLNELLNYGKIKIKIATPALLLKPSKKTLWEKLNNLRPVEQNIDLDLGHNYDGIRELDNPLPPWWLYGFYLTIIFAGIYLWRSNVSHTALSPVEEYAVEMQAAEQQKLVYLAKSAGNVDETSVKLLTTDNDLNAGKIIFQTNCFPCHGKAGEGGVGPNLTDDYWLHGGDIKNVFKTIKYGVAEKGMRSWKDEYSPVQIAQLSSYIMSIHGTNPPNAKEKQGDLYKPDNAVIQSSNSTKVLKDAVKVATK